MISESDRAWWELLRQEAEQDGILFDVYVLAAEMAGWSAFLKTVKARATYQLDGVEAAIPDAVQPDTFSGDSAHSLLIDVGELQLQCNFLADSDVEMHVGPEALRSRDSLDALFDFMVELSGNTGKQVVLTPENCQDRPLFESTNGSSVERVEEE